MTETHPIKIYKMTLYAVDMNNCYKTANDLLYAMDLKCEAMLNEFDVQVAPVNWGDDIDINRSGATQEDYEKYFQVNEMTHEEIEQALGYRIKIK